MLFWFVDGLFYTSLAKYKIDPNSSPSGSLGFFVCLFFKLSSGLHRSGNCQDQWAKCSLAPSHYNTLEVLEEIAKGLELLLLISLHHQLSCKISSTEAANRQEPPAPKNNLGLPGHAIRALTIASVPGGKVGKALEI